MTYLTPPLIDALKKCMGWFSIGHKRESAYGGQPYTPGPLGGSAALGRILLGFSRFASLWPLYLFFLCLFVFIAISYARSPKRKLPPYPRRTPIIGNLSQMTDKTWLFSRECKEQFGEHQDLVRRILTHEHRGPHQARSCISMSSENLSSSLIVRNRPSRCSSAEPVIPQAALGSLWRARSSIKA